MSVENLSFPGPCSTPFHLGSQVELANRVRERFQKTHGRLVFVEGDFYQFSETSGVWEIFRKATFSKAIQRYDGHSVVAKEGFRPLRVGAGFRNGALSCIEVESDDPEFFLDAKTGFTFKNGFVTVTADGVALVPHSSDNRARVGISYEYDPSASRDRFNNFLDEIFEKDDDSIQKQLFLQEFIGACVIGQAPAYQKCVVLIGEGANGKSIFTETVTSLFPDNSRASIPPQDWSNELHRSALAGVLFNSVAEMPSSKIMGTDAFKAVITGDRINARRIRENAFTYAPKAGHLFACNQLPTANDQTHGFWRRFVVLPFNRRFTADAEPKENLTRSLHDELPGIMAWALDGASRLLQQGKYTIPNSHQQTLENWRVRGDPIRDFVNSCCESMDPGESKTQAEVLWRTYCKWAPTRGYKATVSQREFGESIQRLGYERKRGNTGSTYALHIRAESEWSD